LTGKKIKRENSKGTNSKFQRKKLQIPKEEITNSKGRKLQISKGSYSPPFWNLGFACWQAGLNI
jgi:hypothetical protein